MAKIAHPREIKHFIKKNANKETWTFSLEDYLAPVPETPDADGMIPGPLQIFADYSRFRFTLIEKKRQTTTVYGNISNDDLEEIQATTDYATTRIMQKRYETQDSPMQDRKIDPNERLAFTQTISIGECRGMTPVQALLESPENLSELERNASWLKERFDMHRNNRNQFEAITAAVEMFKSNRLAPETDSPTEHFKPIEIIDTGIRTIDSTKREDGKQLVYQLKVTCRFQDEAIYEVEIRNYYAECKGIIPNDTTRTEDHTVRMNLSQKQWRATIRAMNDTKLVYLIAYGPHELKRSKEYISNINNYK